MDFPNRLWVEEVAPHSINCIGRISDHPPSFKDLHNLSDQSWLRIFKINGDDHTSLSFIEIND
jgi:hypothetical protein